MSEPKRRGRPAGPERRIQRSLSMTQAEWARVQAACQRFTHGRMKDGEFARLMLLAAVNDPNVWGSVYADTPQAAIDEAAEIDEDAAELERQMAALNPHS